jgi:hypothetical protein
LTSSDVPHPVCVDRDVIDQVMNITETLANLNYLICVEAENPAIIHSYTKLAEERLQTLARILQSIPTD